jgi:uncharacterized protein YhfF
MAAGVVETTQVRELSVCDIDPRVALDEGEGFASVEDWRLGHERIWADARVSDATLIIAQRFHLVES